MTSIIIRMTPVHWNDAGIMLDVAAGQYLQLNHEADIVLMFEARLGTGLVLEHSLVIESTASLVTGAALSHEASIIIDAVASLLIPFETTGVTGICVNMTTGGHSTYSNYVFDEFICENNKHFATRNGTVYELSGKQDSGVDVDWEVDFPVRDFGTSVETNMQDIYIYMRSECDVEIATITDDQYRRAGYVIENDYYPGMHRRRKLLPKGVKGSSWQLSLNGKGFVEIGVVETAAEKTQRVRR